MTPQRVILQSHLDDRNVMWGTLPYLVCMMLAIVILCFSPRSRTI
ncbi:MAG TPA: hypothetical protein VGV62_09065 [Xanthobacteraceae bacterium]|nr:hypothetical protein [Xanthobacteraceae bacterium]